MKAAPATPYDGDKVQPPGRDLAHIRFGDAQVAAEVGPGRSFRKPCASFGVRRSSVSSLEAVATQIMALAEGHAEADNVLTFAR